MFGEQDPWGWVNGLRDGGSTRFQGSRVAQLGRLGGDPRRQPPPPSLPSSPLAAAGNRAADEDAGGGAVAAPSPVRAAQNLHSTSGSSKIRDLLAPCVCVPAQVARPAGSSALLRPTAAVGLAACTRFPSPSIPCSVPAKSGPHPRHPLSGRLHSMHGRRRQFLAPPPTSVASLRSAPASSPSHHHQPLPLHLTVQKHLEVHAD